MFCYNIFRNIFRVLQYKRNHFFWENQSGSGTAKKLMGSPDVIPFDEFTAKLHQMSESSGYPWSFLPESIGTTLTQRTSVTDGFLRNKVTLVEKTNKVIYQGRMKKGKNRKNFEIYSTEEFIAAITQHIPNKFKDLMKSLKRDELKVYTLDILRVFFIIIAKQSKDKTDHQKMELNYAS